MAERVTGAAMRRRERRLRFVGQTRAAVGRHVPG